MGVGVDPFSADSKLSIRRAERTIGTIRNYPISHKKGKTLGDPWHCYWADKTNSPDEKNLEAWTLSKWLTRKAVDLQKALADINHTLALIGGRDEAIQRAHMIESDILKHMIDTFPVDIPLLPEYQPKVVDRLWVGSRTKELERQRDQFSTYSYWKNPRPDKEQANKAMHLITKAWGRYSQLASADWRGVVEALQEYVDRVEEIQLLLVVARNEQGFGDSLWSGPAARLAKKLRADYRSIHRTLLHDTSVSYPALIIHPWKIDEDIRVMTWKEYQEAPMELWSSELSGPPRLIDGPIFEKGSKVDPESFISERRAELDQVMAELKAARFSIVKGFARREYKILGRAIQSIGQFKRWKVWPE